MGLSKVAYTITDAADSASDGVPNTRPSANHVADPCANLGTDPGQLGWQ